MFGSYNKSGGHPTKRYDHPLKGLDHLGFLVKRSRYDFTPFPVEMRQDLISAMRRRSSKNDPILISYDSKKRDCGPNLA